jgi:hypothetical protein
MTSHGFFALGVLGDGGVPTVPVAPTFLVFAEK